MQASDMEWSPIEQQIARSAFDRAYEREISALIQAVQEASKAIEHLEDLWRLHDFLSAKRYEIDGKYDYRYSALIFVFAGLVKEGWLPLEELEGLNSEKLAKVVALARM